MRKNFLPVLIVIAISIYPITVMINLKISAKEIATNGPFCVQVAAKDSYKEVTDSFDILGLYMKGHGGYHHAVLVVGKLSNPKLFHWSYRKNKFIEGIYGPAPIYCTPRNDFFGTSIDISKQQKENINFSFEKKQFSIPKAYNPKLLWPNPTLSFHATAPDFAPAKEQFFDKRVLNFIEVNFKTTDRMNVWVAVANKSQEIKDLGNFKGLKKELILRPGKFSEPSIQYYYVSPVGKLSTYISCFNSDEIQCLQTFEKDGWTYTFHHLPKEINHWQAMQSKLVQVTKSFAKDEK